MTVSLLPDRLGLLRFPREGLERCSHAILKHILFREYSRSSRKNQDEPLFSYIDNSLEISIFGEAEAIARDFTKSLCQGLEISPFVYRALQVDNDDSFNSSRICTIVEPLARAGVSIFYMSTYQTDLLFVQEHLLPIVFSKLAHYGLQAGFDEEFINTILDTPLPDRPAGDKHDFTTREEEAQDQTTPDTSQRILHSLVTPPGSVDMDVGDDAKVPVCFDQVGPSRIRISPVNILPKSKHGSLNDDGQVVEVVNEDIRPTGSSPTTATAFELRERASRTLPQNLLRCVGLNTELEDGQPWILKVVKILFYGDRVKDNAISQGRGPSHDAPRFFSFTATSDCVSMITDTYILEEFQEHELFMDMDTCPLRLIQLDLHGFGLERHGIIHSVARPLTEAGIDLLYLSTFTSANILVAEHCLSDAERILSLETRGERRDMGAAGL